MAVTDIGASSISSGIKYDSVLAGNVPNDTDYELIETITVGVSGSTRITFVNIPQYYSHLQIRALVKTDDSSLGEFALHPNGASNGMFAIHQIFTDGTGIGSNVAGEPMYITLTNLVGSSPASVFASVICDITDYSSTVKKKVTRSISGWDGNATSSGYAILRSGHWDSSSAIRHLVFEPYVRGVFVQHSTISIYGMR